MAESAKTPTAPIEPAPAPATPAIPAPPAPPSRLGLLWKRFSGSMAALMTLTFFLAFGLGLIFLGFLEHAVRLTHHLPKVLEPILHLVRIPYLLVGLGLFCLGIARGYSYREYSAEIRKNRKSPIRWKIPYIGTQIFLFYVGAIYVLAVAVRKIQPVQDRLALTIVLFMAMGYAVWYLTGWLQTHFQAYASTRIASVAILLGALSFFSWSLAQEVAVSLMLAFFAVVALLTSVAIAMRKGSDQRLEWSRTLFLLGTVLFVGYVAFHALPLGASTIDLRGLNLVLGDPKGEIVNLAYGPRIYERKADDRLTQKLAFALKAKDGWYLQIVDAEDRETPTFKIKAGEGAFKPVFIEEGKAILLDAVQDGSRALWKVDPKTGSVLVLKRSGVEPLGNGVPWNQPTRQFLYVTQTEGKYRLNIWSAASGASRTVVSSDQPILTPSFTRLGDSIVYADGVSGYFHLRSLSTGQTDHVLSQVERAERRTEGLPPVSQVIPAPDGFRYLYLTQKDDRTSFWEVHADGTQREMVLQPEGIVRNISWTPDGQKIVFQEVKHRSGFFGSTGNVIVLDANLKTTRSLIAEQLPQYSPAVSPDGVKVAFVADQGLWYPISGTGIWVAVVR